MFYSISTVLILLAATASTSSPAAIVARQSSPRPLQTPSSVSSSHLNKPVARQVSVPFQACPEQLGKPKQSCLASECGGDTKIAGFCDRILLNGPQQNCGQEGCGVHCACDPIPNEQNGPPPKGQVQFQVCPEMFGNPKKSCSECGGSSNGICKDLLLNGPQDACLPPGCGFYCQCVDGANSPTTQLVTKVLNGQTVTGTFIPTTITQYSGLRASTTITTSENGHQTALAIFAAGVAWGLANWAELGAGVAITASGLPEGAEEDDTGCSKPKKKCSDCGGTNALSLCSSGTEAKCPCEDDKCPKGDNQPNCVDCQGDSSNKCSIDPHKGCDCKADDKCPKYIICDDCGGDNGKLQCNGIANQNNKWKACDCYTLVSDEGIDVYDPFNAYELLEMDLYLVSLAISNGGDTSSEPDRSHPSKDPKCMGDTVPGYTLVNKVKTLSAAKTPKELLYIMRETVCNNKCENPPDIPQKGVFATADNGGCEIAIAISSNVEAWIYRGTQSQGLQWQECWDSTLNIIENCVKDDLATGWVNGPDEYEFFQAGHRPINGDGSKHSPFPAGASLERWCPDTKPSCDTCFGGANNNICSSGENKDCPCEPVTFTQPPAPKVVNCATAIAAAEIQCCNGGISGYKDCGNKIQSCGVTPNLETACQSAVTADGSISTCGQFTADQGITRGSNQEDIATCLDNAFSLKGEWKYA